MTSRFDRTPHKTKRARSLRIGATDAERALWRKLKGKQLEGLKFWRQHPFDRYILDFYCPELKLCIEVDGGQHNEPLHIEHDNRRTEYLEKHGITVIRFWNLDIMNNIEGVVEAIHEQAWNLKHEMKIKHDGVPSPWKGEG